MALDRAGNLYVVNQPANTITIYGGPRMAYRSEITDGISNPYWLTFDKAGTLYVSNYGNNTITVYAPGSGLNSETISDGIDTPAAMTLSR
jgi:DNA-binding beta-propeller fold protein YncE